MKQVRLFDRLRAQWTHPDDLKVAAQCQVIEATNVAEYFYKGHSREYWAFVEDFPNVAPPFPFVFVECEAPDSIVSDEYGVTPWGDYRPSRWGLLIKAMKIEPGPWDASDPVYREIHDTLLFDSKYAGTQEKGLPERPAWMMQVQFFPEHGKGLLQREVSSSPFYMWRIAVNAMGEIMSTSHDAPISWHGRKVKPAAVAGCTNPPRDKGYMKAMHEELTPYLQCGLLTFCFMHCRNVMTPVQQPPKGLSKSFQKKHGVPLIRFRTVEIEPMKKVLEREGGASRVGTQQAIHLCRGHFKHFGEQWGTKALFGKYEGMWFWEPQVRGSKGKGVVLHDYKVDAPE